MSAPLPRPPRVSWSPQALRELEQLVPDRAIQETLKRNAEETLHEIKDPREEEDTDEDPREEEEDTDEDPSEEEDRARKRRAADEGIVGDIMYHRGSTHDQDRDAEWEQECSEDCPANYILFYRKVAGPAGLPEFEVLAVRSVGQIADWWEQRNGGT